MVVGGFTGHLVIDPKGLYRIYHKPFDEASSNTYHFVIPESVGQFIGEFNGFEMYYGDIFKRILDKKNKYKKDHEWADYWLIDWMKESACFTTTCIGNNENGKFKSLIGWSSKSNPYSKRFDEMNEHIGNIYENPELLNQTK